jgi:aryl-alcohol dehydrogenase-like predicted oxidoreductase
VFDTARAYGDAERVLGEALVAHSNAVVLTKGGMARPDGGWRPDGRAASLRRDCETSLRALGRPIDVYLVHAPDPRVPWATTVRALARLLDEKLVRAIGVCNVSLAQLDEALELAPISAVQVAFSLLDDTPLRSGVLARCRERGLTVFAHSPLGGPKRAARLLASSPIANQAARLQAPPVAVALAALVESGVVALAGARHPEAARQIARGATLRLDDEARAALSDFASLKKHVAAAPVDGEVVMIMGLPGAGKSAAAAPFVERGYERLNRDLAGTTLARLTAHLDQRLTAGLRRVVLDNTYLTRAQRAAVLNCASRHGLPVRGIFIDVPLPDAQVNIVLRMLAAHGRLLTPDELRRGRDNTALAPTSLFRMARSVEQPTVEEGFASLELVPFSRTRVPGRFPARFIMLDLVARTPPDELRTAFVVGWQPGGQSTDRVAVCSHGGGPPICWCRPPLPGLLLELAHRHVLDLPSSVLHGTSRAHRALAAAVGMRFVEG